MALIPLENVIQYPSCKWKHSVVENATAELPTVKYTVFNLLPDCKLWAAAAVVAGQSHVTSNPRTAAVIEKKTKHRKYKN